MRPLPNRPANRRANPRCCRPGAADGSDLGESMLRPSQSRGSPQQGASPGAAAATSVGSPRASLVRPQVLSTPLTACVSSRPQSRVRQSAAPGAALAALRSSTSAGSRSRAISRTDHEILQRAGLAAPVAAADQVQMRAGAELRPCLA